jgi:hypothetical protein
MDRQKQLLIAAVAGIAIAGVVVLWSFSRQKASAPETGEVIKVTPETIRENMKNNSAFNR